MRGWLFFRDLLDDRSIPESTSNTPQTADSISSKRTIRTLARRSLRALDAEMQLGLARELEAFDTFALADERRAAVHALLGRLAQVARQHGLAGNPDAFLSAAGELDLERVVKLLDLQSDHVIAIGE